MWKRTVRRYLLWLMHKTCAYFVGATMCRPLTLHFARDYRYNAFKIMHSHSLRKRGFFVAENLKFLTYLDVRNILNASSRLFGRL